MLTQRLITFTDTLDAVDFISFTDAAKLKNCGRNTLYRADDDGRLNSAEVAGRRLLIRDDAFENFEPKNKGQRVARRKQSEDDE